MRETGIGLPREAGPRSALPHERLTPLYSMGIIIFALRHQAWPGSTWDTTMVVFHWIHCFPERPVRFPAASKRLSNKKLSGETFSPCPRRLGEQRAEAGALLAVPLPPVGALAGGGAVAAGMSPYHRFFPKIQKKHCWFITYSMNYLWMFIICVPYHYQVWSPESYLAS